MLNKTLSSALLGLLLLMLPLAASAQEQPAHEGFFLRLQAGGGYLGFESKENDSSFSGFSGAFNVMVGLSLLENFAVYGEFSVYAAPGPTLTLDGRSTTANEKVTLSLGGLGLGASYYFWEDFFVGASFRWVQMRTEVREKDAPDDGEVLAQSDLGAVGTVHLGKEWWVGGHWTLGVAGEFGLGSVSNDRDDWVATQYSVLFSSTFN